DVRCKEPCSHMHNHGGYTPAVPLIPTVATPSMNPFATAHSGSYIHSTPVSCHPTGPQSHSPYGNSLKNVNNAAMPLQPPLPIYEPHKSRVRRPCSIRHHASSESE